MQFSQPDTLIPDTYNKLDWNRYAYARYNPLRYTDPDGHRPVQGCGEDGKSACYASDLEKAINAQKLAELEYDPTGQKQEENAAIAEAILYDGTEIVASVLFEPVDWASTVYHCANGDCSAWMLLGMAPFIPGSAGKHAGKYGDDLAAIVGQQGFETFDQLKKYLGPAGDGIDWHHIVEQSQIIKSGFSPQMVHNTANVIAVDKATHNLISAVYNTNIAGPGTGRIRDWLAGQSFSDQYKFGLQVLRNLGVIP